ncbi:MAG: 3-phosphoserine/phosphohydroxythreonine transaminase [Wenzhouxiangellaceae bacterium]|nr:3-phosphoserine/phosphohydroxythreonine transaminase [Wenzhouxiangellaceae bacterium]MBS3747842.1 3-phosphoserine/phosphohydroxythreonine transaminase [Wenzhouxiangellaceae bacterium]MBS3824383.1 3-phosphoserine/phosphohydroxythreonine transaminase [Wenzhouxiangellaceae bacterium]
MNTIHNFSAGPAALPWPVRERLADEFSLDEAHTPSIAEVSHRGPRFAEVAERLRAGIRKLAGIGDEHEVLLLQGGAHLQFAMLPTNFARGRTAAFMLSGHWGEKAFAESARITESRVVASSADEGYQDLPELGHLPADAAYLHYTGNETIHGVQFEQPPAAAVPLVADMSSEFLSRPYPYADLALAYAGAQKNLGVAGLTVVLVRRDLLDRIPDDLPQYLDYRTWIESGSMKNTPSTFAWFVAAEVIDWIESGGGLEKLGARNRAKADKLYAAIDASDFYSNPVAPEARSMMNIPFVMADDALTKTFVEQAEAAGMPGLKGHRAVGGLRASLYNALGMDAVDALVTFMHEFERKHG